MAKKEKTTQTITDTPAQATTDTELFQTVNNVFLNFSKCFTFANCGMERTVFNIETSSDTLTADITFKKTRLRDKIPEYAGIYWIFSDPLNVVNGAFQFKLCSPNKTLGSIDVEIKPEDKKWMHEVFHYKLPKDSSELSCTINIPLDFTNKKTAQCLGEVTFVIHPSDFVSDTKLTGQLVISGMSFTPETKMYKSTVVSIDEKLSSIDDKMDGLGEKMDSVSQNTQAIMLYIKNTLNVNIVQMKNDLNKKIASNEAMQTIEKEISKAFSECTKKLNDDLMYTGMDISKTIIDMSKKHLEELFGADGLYQKMQSYTQISLVSAACLWESCKNIAKDKEFDYSGVCISATSALENELKRIFYHGFYAFLLKEKKRNEKGTSNCFTMHTVIDILKPNYNSIEYILKVYTNYSGPTAQNFIDEMGEYLSKLCGKKGVKNFDYKEYLKDESKRIDTIRENYRNKAAHTEKVSQDMAAKCYNEIIGKSKAEQINRESLNILLALYKKINIDTLIDTLSEPKKKGRNVSL